jgi:tRNA(Ile)-lysidine synthase
MSLIDDFRRELATLRLRPGRALVAVSGGPDSVALLDLLVESRDTHAQQLVVAHVDHGIHPESANVAEQVRSLAHGYGLPVHVGRLKLGPDATETRARQARYDWLEELRGGVGAEVIFTAHHADDQVETVLMRFLAGSGPAGLTGMLPVRGALVRPLLSFRRADLLAYLQGANLVAWADPANSDPRHLRSWVRGELLPVLRGRMSEVDRSILRTAHQSGRDRAAWDALLGTLPSLDLRAEIGGISVAASSLAGYDSKLTEALILAMARRVGCQVGPARLGRILGLLAAASSGSRVPLGANWTAELTFGRLRIYRTSAASVDTGWFLEGDSGRRDWGHWSFRWSRSEVPDQQQRTGLTAWFPWQPLAVRAWLPGDKVRPLGGTGRRLAVRCFQEVRVPRSQRQSWPVLTQNEEIIWIPGVCRSDVQLPSRGSEALRVDAEYA